MQIQDLTPGNSYACRFRTQTTLDDQGQPAPNLRRPTQGTGEYTGLGVIMQRDTAQQLVRLRDVASDEVFVVAWQDCWDVDTVEWKEPFDAGTD